MITKGQYETPPAHRHVNTKTFHELFARRWPLQEGEVAVEFELEGKGPMARAHAVALGEVRADANGFPKKQFWSYHQDGSLDPNRGFELVYTKPVNRFLAFEENIKLFNTLVPALLDNSNRCSTHVHLNAQKWTMQQLAHFATLYYIYENAFFKVHGLDREGSIFCLRLEDCPAIVDNYRDIMQSGRFSGRACNEEWRYASLNLAALKKFGSLELRSHKACENAQEINNWIKALLDLYDHVRVNKDAKPSDLMYNISREGVVMFTRNRFPDLYRYIMNVPDLARELDEGIWRAQDIAFCADWHKLQLEEKKEVKVNLDDYIDDDDDEPIRKPVGRAANINIQFVNEVLGRVRENA